MITLNNLKKTLLVLFLFFVTSTFAFSYTNPDEPNFGTASTYAIFTCAGAINNTGLTTIAGDIGYNTGSITGFPPGTYTGTLNQSNGATALACSDLGTVFANMSALTPDAVIGVGLGSGQILTRGIYRAGGASTIGGSLTFSGSATDRFIVIIDGALSPNASTEIILDGGAKAENIYWAINGAVSVAGSVVFRGNIVANGEIIFSDNAALHGRALSTAGDITLAGNQIAIPTDSDVDDDVLVVTTTPFNITETSFESGGTITLSNSPEPIDDKGLIWSTTIDPTTTSNMGSHSADSGPVTFTHEISGLSPGYKYYVRAYAVNTAGTYYGLSRLVAAHEWWIPTLTEWAVIVFIGLLAGVGGLFIWKRV